MEELYESRANTVKYEKYKDTTGENSGRLTMSNRQEQLSPHQKEARSKVGMKSTDIKIVTREPSNQPDLLQI